MKIRGESKEGESKRMGGGENECLGKKTGQEGVEKRRADKSNSTTLSVLYLMMIFQQTTSQQST